MDDDVRKAAAAAVTEKFHDLMEQRGEALRQRAELERRVRTIDRALFDCRAAGRLFGIDIEVPEDARPGVIIPSRAAEIARRAAEARRIEPPPSLFSATSHLDAKSLVTTNATVLPAVASTMLNPGTEPSIRDLVLMHLEKAGSQGEKANVLRRKVEAFLNRQIHYKTIGMSLYRLSKETPPRVRREGQTWFLAYPWSAAKDPGAPTPGSPERR
jgi:hypothetical protein